VVDCGRARITCNRRTILVPIEGHGEVAGWVCKTCFLRTTRVQEVSWCNKLCCRLFGAHAWTYDLAEYMLWWGGLGWACTRFVPNPHHAQVDPSTCIFPLLPKITTRSPRFGFGDVLRGSISSYFDPFYDTKLSLAPSFARRTHTMSQIFFIFWYPQFRAHKHVPAD